DAQMFWEHLFDGGGRLLQLRWDKHRGTPLLGQGISLREASRATKQQHRRNFRSNDRALKLVFHSLLNKNCRSGNQQGNGCPNPVRTQVVTDRDVRGRDPKLKKKRVKETKATGH